MSLQKKITYSFKILSLSALFSLVSIQLFAQGSQGLTGLDGADIDFSKQLTQVKQLKLDDPFHSTL